MITSTQCYHETHVTQYILCSQYHKIYRKVNRCWLSILTTMLLSSLLSSCIMKEIFLFSVIKIFSLISYCKSQIFAPAWIQLELFLSVVCVKSLFFFLSHRQSFLATFIDSCAFPTVYLCHGFGGFQWNVCQHHTAFSLQQPLKCIYRYDH